MSAAGGLWEKIGDDSDDPPDDDFELDALSSQEDRAHPSGKEADHENRKNIFGVLYRKLFP